MNYVKNRPVKTEAPSLFFVGHFFLAVYHRLERVTSSWNALSGFVLLRQYIADVTQLIEDKILLAVLQFVAT